jgi:hypothetical protein
MGRKKKVARYANEPLRYALLKLGIEEVLRLVDIYNVAAIVDHIVRTIQITPLDPAFDVEDTAAEVIMILLNNLHRIDVNKSEGEKINYLKRVISSQIVRKIYRERTSVLTEVSTNPDDMYNIGEARSFTHHVHKDMTMKDYINFLKTCAGVQKSTNDLFSVIHEGVKNVLAHT